MLWYNVTADFRSTEQGVGGPGRFPRCKYLEKSSQAKGDDANVYHIPGTERLRAGVGGRCAYMCLKRN